MKVIAALLSAASASAVSQQGDDRTVTQVVKLLQGMLDKSVKEGDEERKIYAKFKCYCDQSTEEKEASIAAGKKEIALLESQIEEVQGDTGGLSSECADLKAKMAENKAARDEATALREKENSEFKAEKADLKEAISDMKRALATLAKVGADQTASTGADNKQFMAGKGANLLEVQNEVGHALRAASAMMTAEQQKVTTSFLQAPFTGTYTSQSAVVMGIIKSMRDTFEKNLEDAIVTENNAQEAYDKFMDLKKQAHKEMSESYNAKQKLLGGNDGNLATKREQLASAEKQLASDEEFMSKLTPLCEEKAAGYANRKMLRANEEAAVAKAISILNSDEAFASFGKTDATSTGFLQLRAVHKHIAGHDNVRSEAEKLLKDTGSKRLSKVTSLLQAENPFDEVLGEIKNMLSVIEEEGAADKEKLNWCNSERKENKQNRKIKKDEIVGLKKDIDTLTGNIEKPGTGLLAQIQATEEALVENTDSQTTQTKERTESNVAYQQDIKNLVSAQRILEKAIKVLKTYYDDLEQKLANGEALLQKSNKGKAKEDPNAGEAWKGDGAYAGQNKAGGDVLEMLDFILTSTHDEETKAHEEEEKAQGEYEDSMTSLKKQEAKSEKLLVSLQEDLAETQEKLLKAKEDLKQTTADKVAIEEYLEKIKPGCDFITKNFDLREKNRATEADALKKARRLIKGTPAYQTAVANAKTESYGDCKEPCTEFGEGHVKCKACMSDVTIPAYCAGHKGTRGC